MTADEFTNAIVVIAEEAERRLSDVPDFPSVEPLYDDVLRLVAANPALRAEFSGLLVSFFGSGHDHLELVAYCAHALRWPELRKTFEALLRDTNDMRTRDSLGRILEAFEDTWSLREIYARWSATP